MHKLITAHSNDGTLYNILNKRIDQAFKKCKCFEICVSYTIIKIQKQKH